MPVETAVVKNIFSSLIADAGKKADGQGAQVAATTATAVTAAAGDVKKLNAAAIAAATAGKVKPPKIDLPKLKLDMPLSFEVTATSSTPGAKLDAPRLSRDNTMLTYLEREPKPIPGWMMKMLNITDPTERMRAFVAPVDGSSAPVQIAGQTFHNVVEPAFSPDGKAVIYCQQKNYPFVGSTANPIAGGYGERLKDMRLDQVDLATKKVTTIYDGDLSLLHPQYSPDGTKIAAYSRDPGREGIYLIDTKNLGAEPKRLIDTPADDKHPVWTDDGKRLYFHNQKGGDAVDDRGDATEQAWLGYIDLTDPAKPKRVMLDNPNVETYHKHPTPLKGTDLLAYHNDDHQIEVVNVVTGDRARMDLSGTSPNGSNVKDYKHASFGFDGQNMVVLGKAKSKDELNRGLPETWRLYMQQNAPQVGKAFDKIFPPAAK